MAWESLKSAVSDVIKANGSNQITGPVLQDTLVSIINNLGNDCSFVGVATPTTVPGSPDGKVFYLATSVGTYSNFSALTVSSGEIAILTNRTGSWTKQVLNVTLSDGFVTSAKLADNSVSTSKIIDGAITAIKIAINAITESKIADLAVSTVKIANDAITDIKLAINSVTTSKIVDFAVTSAKIASSAIIESKIADYAVTAIKIATSTITVDKFSLSAILELVGAYTKLTNSSLIDNFFQTPNGNLVSNTLNYDILVFDVTAGCKVKVRTNILFTVTANQYVIASLYNGSTWVSDVLLSRTGVTMYDFEVEIPLGVTKMYVMVHGTKSTEYVVTQSSSWFPAPKNTADISNLAITNAKIADNTIQASKIESFAKTELVGVYTKPSYTIFADNTFMRLAGVLQTTSFNYDILVFSVIPKTKVLLFTNIVSPVTAGQYAIASLYNSGVWVSDVVISTTSVLYDAEIEIPLGVNQLYVSCHGTKYAECIVTQRSLLAKAPIQASDIGEGAITSAMIANDTIKTEDINSLAKIELSGNNALLSPVLFADNTLLRPSGVLQTTTTNYDLMYCSVMPGREIILHTNIVFTVTASQYVIAAFYSDNDWIADIILSVSGATIYDVKCIVPTGANRIVFLTFGTRYNEIIVTQSMQIVSIKQSVDKVLNFPTKVWGMVFNSNTTVNFFNRLYAEGVASQAMKSLRLNNKPNIILDSTTQVNAGTTNINVSVSADDYQPVTKTVQLQLSNYSSLQNREINFMGIGDSLTFEGYTALLEHIFKCINQDLGSINYMSVGRTLKNLAITYANKTFTNRGCCEGQSGWAVEDYLRKCTLTRAKVSGTSLNGKAAWDSLGLGTKTRNGVPTQAYQTFVYSEETGEAIRTACHGWYDADPSLELWNYICVTRGMAGQSFTVNDTTYTFGSTYSTADNEAQKAYIVYLCKNPDTRFYDYNTVQSTNGAYAFNFQTYMDRYKTVDTNGNRLVVGSTAGSRVTNVNDYDVREDVTHVAIFMNENSSNQISTGDNVALDLILIGNLIRQYNSNIKVALGATRGYGVFDPDAYNDFGLLNTATVVARRYDCNKRLQTEIATNSPQFTYLPLYSIQSVRGTKGGVAIDLLDQQTKVRFNGDGLHTGNIVNEYADRANLVLSWIAST